MNKLNFKSYSQLHALIIMPDFHYLFNANANIRQMPPYTVNFGGAS